MRPVTRKPVTLKPVTLKSAVFRRDREAGWRDLDALVGRVERHGVTILTADQALALPALYRSVLSSLSVARAISLDRAVVMYLETLATRAFACVYGNRTGLVEAAGAFFGRRWPQAVRETVGPVLLSAAILVLGAVIAFLLVRSSPDWFHGFMPADLAGNRTPDAPTATLRDTLYDDGHTDFSGELHLFATYLFTHNAQVAILCFALGICFGVPTVFLLLSNGCMLGAFVALFAGRGLGVEAIGWLSIHGATELFAIILAGAAGLKLGGALAFPGRHARLVELADAGRTAGLMMVGVICMLLVAGVLEGIGRQMIQDTAARYLIGWSLLAGWVLYFAAAGRRSGGETEGA